MKTEQINIRLEADLVAALERVAREEALDRTTAVRRLLETSIRRWEIERALRAYQEGELSLGRAAEEAGLTQWELLDAIRHSGIAYPLDAETVRERIGELTGGGGGVAATLPDIPPKPGGVLLVGINPAPPSVAAGHYYQGRLGRRLWRRLEEVGLLRDAMPGAEDEAFAAAGHGLTDLVKRPTRASSELSPDELKTGIDALLGKITEWRPGLVLFAFKEPARRLLGEGVSPGPGAEIAGVPTFLLSGPYAARAERERIDAELRLMLARLGPAPAPVEARSQHVTASDLARGQIRLKQDARALFPPQRATVEIVLRGVRVGASYDPRVGPDRNRSPVLRVGGALRELVRTNEVLDLTRGLAGVVVLD
jgi:TDG/mug DNA glycosylase family protein